MNILQDLYDSEINFRIKTFWDAGFDVRLGDTTNRFIAETNCYTLDEAIEFLKAEAIKHYPNSEFSIKYKELSDDS